MSPFLYRALVEGGLASDLHTEVVPTRYPYLYSIQATCREGITASKIEAAVVREIDRLSRGEITARDLQRARNQFQARHALEGESVTDVAHQLGFFETIGDHRIWIDLPRRIAAVRRADVAAFARKRLDHLHRTVGVLHPVASLRGRRGAGR